MWETECNSGSGPDIDSARLSPVSQRDLRQAVQRAPHQCTQLCTVSEQCHRPRDALAAAGLAETFLTRGFIFSCEAVRDWEAKLTPALAENRWWRRNGRVGSSWYIDETYIQVRGEWQ